MSHFDGDSQGSWKESNIAVWAMVLKWVNLYPFPKFLFWMVLKWVKCCCVWRVLKWFNVHHFTSFSQIVCLCCYTTCCLDFGCPIHVVQWCSTAVLAAFLPLPGLYGEHFPGLHGELSSSLLHGDLSSVLGGLPGLLRVTDLSVHWLLGFVLLGLDFSGCAGLPHHESFFPSRADFFSEMKLKASFSAMSQFSVLALTQSSKVLKEIDLLSVSSMVLKETLLVPLLSMDLKEIEVALLTSCSVSWKETFSLPDLPMVLKEISASTFDRVFGSVGTILFSDDSYAIHTKDIGGSQLVSVFFFLSPAWCIFGWGLERSLSACACSHGLERTGWMVLKGLRCNSLVPLWCFAVSFQAKVLKGISGVGVCLVF